MRKRSITSVFAVSAVALGLAACGGSNDGTDGAEALKLVGYSVPKHAFDPLIAGFQRTPAGKGVTFSSSFGASADQSRSVAAGMPADIVNFSAAPDVTRLVGAGLVAQDWNRDAHQGIVSTSVVTIVVRKGNPKRIKDWDDLLAPGVGVVTPNPVSSGSGAWNLLAAYADKSRGGKRGSAGLRFVKRLLRRHVTGRPPSARAATEAFLQGSGDALLTYESEALFLERQGERVTHVTPPTTVKVESPLAVLVTSKHPQQAKAFKAYLYTPEAQTVFAEAGFRPVVPAVAAKYAATFPAPKKLWTIDELGGWAKLEPALFDPVAGSITKIYNAVVQ